MTRRQWVRRMMTAAALLLVLGLALLLTGSLLTGHGVQPRTGVAIGLTGVFLLTAGGLCGKFAIAGPYPKNVEAE
ncbi:MAG: hypothetical protein V4510_04875 [bacterium]